MVKLEAQMQAAFGRWVQNRWDKGSAAFELKRTTSRSLPISAIRGHQLQGLNQAAGRGSYFKIPDGGFSQSPYDCYFLRGEAYVVIAYGPKLVGFYLIPIDVIELLKKREVVSITEKFAAEFGEYHEIPKKLPLSNSTP